MKRVLNFKEACEFLGFSSSYVYKLIHYGKIPYSKPNGKTLFFDRLKLEEWMLSNSSCPIELERKAATYVATKKRK